MSPYDAEMTLRDAHASRGQCARAVAILSDSPDPYRRHVARQTTIAMGLTAHEIDGEIAAHRAARIAHDRDDVPDDGMSAPVDRVPLLFWLLVGVPLGLAVWLAAAPPAAAAIYGWAAGLAEALVDRMFGGMAL